MNTLANKSRNFDVKYVCFVLTKHIDTISQEPYIPEGNAGFILGDMTGPSNPIISFEVG
jgi:hypothetical protein